MDSAEEVLLEEDIVVVDENEVLKLYSYKSCSNEDDDEKKGQRGIIKDLNGDVVTTSLPYTNEYVYDDSCNHPCFITSDNQPSDYLIYPSIEGTIIRVFWYQDQWYISTNRKLDAFKSYWSSHLSFGQLFVNEIFMIYNETTIEAFMNRLQKEYVYFFLLRPTIESRIVCEIDNTKPSLYFIGYLTKENLNGNLNYDSDVLSEISRMEEIHFETWDDVLNYVKDINIWESQGVILFERERNKQIKILNGRYKYMWSIRNNNPNLYLRYLEIRSDNNKMEDFFKLYPKFISIADKIENKIFEISKYIHEAYIQRYIQKKYLSLPKQEYMILKKAHEWHNVDKNHNRIYRTKILQLLNEEQPIYIYQMIKRPGIL